MNRRLLFTVLGVLFVGTGALSAQTDLLKAYQDRGRMLSKLSKHEQALPYFLLALEMAEKEFGRDSPEVVPLLNDLADSYVERRDYGDAEPLLLRSLDIQEGRIAELVANAARTAGTLASLYEETERPQAAVAVYRRILERWQPTLGANHTVIRTARQRLTALTEAEVEEAPAAPVAPPAPLVGEPAYLVHLTSIRDPDKAEAEWARLQRVYPDLLAGLALSVTRADLKDRGTYYRIHAGPLDKAGADHLCAQVGARGAWCNVVQAPEIAAPPPAPEAKPEPEVAGRDEAPASPPPAAPETGTYRIHLTSIRDAAEAEAEWARLKRLYGDLLNGLGLTVERADLGPERGIYFRIEGGPLSRDRARKLCAAFAARDIWCRVVPPTGTADASQRVAAGLRDRRSGPRSGTRRGRPAASWRQRHAVRRRLEERACRRVPGQH
jgi:tetratricopeptide (TPR) repeat protein